MLVKGAKRLANTKCSVNQLTANQVTGYDVDTGKLVAKGLGVEPCFVTPTWTEITGGQWGDRWDLVLRIRGDQHRPDEAAVDDHSLPVRAAALLRAEVVAVSEAQRPGRKAHRRMRQLHGRVLSPRNTSRFRASDITRDVQDPKIVDYAVEPPGLRATAKGKIDAYLSAEAVGMEAIHQGEDLRPLKGDAFTMYLTGFLDKSSALTQAAFAQRIDQIVAKAQKDGELKALSMKYFGKDYGSESADYSVSQLHQKIPASGTG